MTERFEDHLTAQELELLARLAAPADIQAYLDATPYSPEYRDRCPLNVMRDRLAHCQDGALFAAMALRRLGDPPLIVVLLPEPDADDDHWLAVFRRSGHYGAVAKSNFTGLRFREPVYRSLRELVMSYFEPFYNVYGERTLRGYTRPLDLAAFDRFGWQWHDEGSQPIVKRLAEVRYTTLLTPEMIARLSPVDKLSYDAGMLVGNPAGLYKPQRRAN